MAEKTMRLSFVTGRGTLRYPKITEPDTKGEYADGKYKTDFVPDDMGALREKVMAFAVECFGEKKAPKVQLPFGESKDGEEEEFFRAKTKSEPKLADVKGRPIKGGINVGGGTIAKLSVTLNKYDKGINAYLNGVQIIKLVEYGGGGAAFEDATGELDDDEEGFNADEGEFNDATAESGEDESEDAEEKPKADKKPAAKSATKKAASGKKPAATDF